MRAGPGIEPGSPVCFAGVLGVASTSAREGSPLNYPRARKKYHTMAEQQKPVIRTVVTSQGYARAVILAWKHVAGPDDVPSKEAVAVLYSQWITETGGASCWNWNFSNAKHFAGDGFDYMCLNGVWEGVTPANAETLVSAGRAIRDPSPDHARAVGSGRVSVIFPPPQPESRFRAFTDLASGMRQHLQMLQVRFSASWPWILGGNPKGTAQALKTHGYFTADAGVYGSNMQRAFDGFMKTSAYELAVEGVDTDREAETQPDLENPASSPTIHVLSYSPTGDDEPPSAA